MAEKYYIDITPSESVTAISYSPAPGYQTEISLILAHGRGSDQSSDFMVHLATALAANGIHTITFNFQYAERKRSVVDCNDRLEACFRTIIRAFRSGKFNIPIQQKLVIGGRSMGARVASQIASEDGVGVAAVALLSYPLHKPGFLIDEVRTDHWIRIKAPIIFVQGSDDRFGSADELSSIIQSLNLRTDLYVVPMADASFRVPKKKSPISQDQIYHLVAGEIGRRLQLLV